MIVFNGLIFMASCNLLPRTSTFTGLSTSATSPYNTHKLLISSLHLNHQDLFYIKSEVLDLHDPNIICEVFPDFNPILEFNGIIWNNGVILNKVLLFCGCGDLDGKGNIWHCTTMDTEITMNLGIKCTIFSRSVFLSDDTLFLTGTDTETNILKFQYGNEYDRKMRISKMIQGPELPYRLFYHCITKINETFIAVIGDYHTNGTLPTLFIDIAKNSITTSTFELNQERRGHTCATFQHDGKTKVIIAGGHDQSNFNLDSTEILDISSNEGWEKG